MELERQKIVEAFARNLERGRAGAVGIGVFAAIFNNRGEILLRRRIEKGSLICNDELSGKWELPGGGVDLEDFQGDADYQGAAWICIDKELQEEVCLSLSSSALEEQLVMLPAWLAKPDNIDLAFAVPIRCEDLQCSNLPGEYFSSFEEGLEKGLVRYFSEEEVESLNIISPRMSLLIAKGFRYYGEHMM